MIENRHIWALALTAVSYSILIAIAIVVPIAIAIVTVPTIVTVTAIGPVTRDRVYLDFDFLPVIMCVCRFAPYKTIISRLFFHNRDSFIISSTLV